MSRAVACFQPRPLAGEVITSSSGGQTLSLPPSLKAAVLRRVGKGNTVFYVTYDNYPKSVHAFDIISAQHKSTK